MDFVFFSYALDPLMAGCMMALAKLCGTTTSYSKIRHVQLTVVAARMYSSLPYAIKRLSSSNLYIILEKLPWSI